MNFLSVVHAQIVGNKPSPLTGAAGLQGVLENIIRLLLPFGAVVLFVMLLYGGIMYISSGPNPGNVEKAKATLTYAIAGTVLLAMSFLILVLIQQITGAKVTVLDLTF